MPKISAYIIAYNEAAKIEAAVSSVLWADEIVALISGTPAHDAYLVPRRSYMMGRWITGSGWYPNYRQPQLFRKGAMRYKPDKVHEGYELLTAKPLGRLNSAIQQFPFRNMEE